MAKSFYWKFAIFTSLRYIAWPAAKPLKTGM